MGVLHTFQDFKASENAINAIEPVAQDLRVEMTASQDDRTIHLAGAMNE